MAPATTERRKKKIKGDTRSLAELKSLGNELLSSRKAINNLPTLLGYITPTSPPQHTLECLLTLQSFFTNVIPDLPPSSFKASNGGGSGGNTDPEFIYLTWVRSKLEEFTRALIDIATCVDCDETLREVVLDSIMELIKLGNRGKFYNDLYHRLLLKIVCSPLEVEFLVELLASKYLNYIDVRYFTYISIEKLAKTLETSRTSKIENRDEESCLKASSELSIRKMHFILLCIPPEVPADGEVELDTWGDPGFLSKEDDLKDPSKTAEDGKKESKKDNSNKNGFHSSRIFKRMKFKYSKAWMTFLRLPLPLEVYKEVLVNLHDAVIPFMSNPVMLCDFLTKSCDIGGVVSVMSLNSLFILMTRHGLEYPNFYEKLYSLLVPSIFMAKYRAKFFELLDTCLKSPLLPAYLAASFTKKLSRLSLVVPPSGALVTIALIHNLLCRHPSINCLVHREDDGESAQDDSTANEKQGVDLFKDEESNPMKSNALRSSLWEIYSLRQHYCPHVSRFVMSLENDLTARAKTTEMLIGDFSSGSYSTIFGEEMRRRVKQVPLAIYKAAPTSLFSQADFPGWTFEHGEKTETEAININQKDSDTTKRKRVESN